MARRANESPRLLVTHRNACVLLERARLHVSGDRVVYHAAEPGMVRRFNLPHCNTAVVFLGQGTSITQEAAHRLAEEGVLVAFTGSGGTPLLMGTLVSYQATAHFRRLMPIYDSAEASLRASRVIMRFWTARMRKATSLRDGSKSRINSVCDDFDARSIAAQTHGELMAAEGDFAKSCYAIFCQSGGFTEFGRNPGSDISSSRVGVMNRMIDHGNYLAYGIAGAAIWALGIPAHMSVMHGKTRAGGLVFDVADAWKDSVVIPRALEHSRSGDEIAFRNSVIDDIEDHGLLALSFQVVEDMILAGEEALGPTSEDIRFKSGEKTK